ncbi:hypothetical protein GGP72_000263 [Salinibacter ruber]|uniref:Outer membrane protein beta-barrel domain-containing protein n=1 Tax=Salinibacter ruber TaxID=146919 RepID=A0A9X2TEI3_9BACT|nr:DUF6588 family protein [Salinibacter ruber]MCS3676367.1 hypothetical protein [Salinibacter ruber]MCS3679654.1 hypothetical protein [Salinibacter ruber]
MHTLQARLLPFLIVLAVLVVPPSQAQNRDTDELGGALSSIGQQYADNYTQPITDALGANLNAGLFRTAEVGGEGIIPVIDVYVGVAGMGALTSGSASSFAPQTEKIPADDGGMLKVKYEPNQVPTVFGEERSPGQANIFDESDQKIGEVDLPSGLINTPIAPLAIPQIGAGTVLGTDAQVRFLPETSISDYGSVSLFGLSVRHSLSQYIPLSPVNLAVQGTWQSLSLSGSDDSINSGEIVDASGWALNAQVSKSLPVAPITFYGGLQYEQFGVDVGYTFEATTNQRGNSQTSTTTSTVSFEQDASNNVRALAGVSVTLAVIQLNVDYALASNNTVSAGVGITL